MGSHIYFCDSCKKYTMQQICTCNAPTRSLKPAKFSLEEKYANYRREAKRSVPKEQ